MAKKRRLPAPWPFKRARHFKDCELVSPDVCTCDTKVVTRLNKFKTKESAMKCKRCSHYLFGWIVENKV